MSFSMVIYTLCIIVVFTFFTFSVWHNFIRRKRQALYIVHLAALDANYWESILQVTQWLFIYTIMMMMMMGIIL